MASMFSPRQGTAIPPPKDLVELMRVVIAVTGYPIVAALVKTVSGRGNKADMKKAAKKGKRGNGGGSGRLPLGDQSWSSCDPESIVKTSKNMLNSNKFAEYMNKVPVHSLSPQQVLAIQNLTKLPHQAVAMQRAQSANFMTIAADSTDQEVTKEKELLQIVADAAAIASAPLMPSALIAASFAIDDELDTSQVVMTTREKEILQLVDMIRGYIFMLKIHIDVSNTLAQIRRRADDIAAQAASIISERKDAMDDALRELEELRSMQETNLHLLENQLMRNRRKIDGLNRMNEHSAQACLALAGCRTYLIAELAQLTDTLRTFVCDCCVAAAVLVRASWLPDKVRVDCAAQLRGHLLSRGYCVTEADSSFLLGALLDRQQVRRWTAVPLHCPRDPPSINCMSLVWLSPLFTFVYDPDGTAEKALGEASPQGYELCTVSALRFSLTQLEDWISAAYDASGDAAAICLLITDTQAGLSRDLVSLLSADLAVQTQTPRHQQQQQQQQQQTVLNAKVIVPAVCNSSERYELIAHLMEAGSGVRSHRIAGAEVAGQFSIILGRLRLYLLSTRMQVMDPANGVSAPLSAVCMKNVSAVVHWTVALQPSVAVNPAALDAEGSNNYTSGNSQVMVSQMVHSLFGKIHGHDSGLVDLNEQILRSATLLHKKQCLLVNLVYKFAIGEERYENKAEFVVSDSGRTMEQVNSDGESLLNIRHRPVCVGFVSVDRIRKYLLGSQADITAQTRVVEDFHALERDALVYQAAGGETFALSLAVLRIGAAVVPATAFPVYALTPRVIATRFISVALERADKCGLISGVPESLQAMRRVSLAISALQFSWRQKKMISAEPPAPATSDHPTQPMADIVASAVRKATKIHKKRLNEAKPLDNRTPGLHPAERRQSFQELGCLLRPLRSFFAAEALEYLRLIVRPGYEWLVKFCALLVAWETGSTGADSKCPPPPLDELRFLLSSAMSNARHAPTKRFTIVVANIGELLLPHRTAGTTIDAVLHTLARDNNAPGQHVDGEGIEKPGGNTFSSTLAACHGWGPMDGVWMPGSCLSPPVLYFPTLCDDPSTFVASDRCAPPLRGSSVHPLETAETLAPAGPMFADVFEAEFLSLHGVKAFAVAANVPCEQHLSSRNALLATDLAGIVAEADYVALQPPQGTSAGLMPARSTSTRGDRVVEMVSLAQDKKMGVDEKRVNFIVQSVVRNKSARRQARSHPAEDGTAVKPIATKNTFVHATRFTLGPRARKNLKVLEQHSSFFGVFRDFEFLLQADDNNRLFLSWRQSLVEARGLCFSNLDSEHLLITVRKLAAPALRPAANHTEKAEQGIAEADERKDSIRVLSVVQTLVLAEALFPGEDLMFTIVDALSALLARAIQVRVISGVHGGSDKIGFAKDIVIGAAAASLLDDTNLNSWSQLLTTATTSSVTLGPLSTRGNVNSAAALQVGRLLALAVGPEPSTTGKYAAMKTLRDSLSGNNSNSKGLALLLADDDDDGFWFNRELRHLGDRIGRVVQVVSCQLSSTNEGESSTDAALEAAQLLKTIRATMTSAKKTQQVCLDSLDLLYSSSANAVFSSSLFQNASGFGGSIVLKSNKGVSMDEPPAFSMSKSKAMTTDITAAFVQGEDGDDAEDDDDAETPMPLAADGGGLDQSQRHRHNLPHAMSSGKAMSVDKGGLENSTTSRPEASIRGKLEPLKPASQSGGGGEGGMAPSKAAAAASAAQTIVTVPWGAPELCHRSSSSSEDQLEYGFSPLLCFTELMPLWMPRLHIGDLVVLKLASEPQTAQRKGSSNAQTTTSHVASTITDGGPMPPPLFQESAGIFCHMLDSRLYSFLGSVTLINLSQLKVPTYDILRQATKLEIRVASCMLVLRELIMLDGCSALQRAVRAQDANNDNTCWSWSLESVSAWALVRLLANVREILVMDWSTDAVGSANQMLLAIRNCIFHLQPQTASRVASDTEMFSFYGSAESQKKRQTPNPHQTAGTAGYSPVRLVHTPTKDTAPQTMNMMTPNRPTLPVPSKPGFRESQAAAATKGKFTVAHEYAVAFRKIMYDMRGIERFGVGPVGLGERANSKPSLMQSMVTSFLFRLLSTLSSKSTRGGGASSDERNPPSPTVADAVKAAEDHMILAHGGIGILSWKEVIRSLVVWTLDATSGNMEKSTVVDREWTRKKWKNALRLLFNVARFIVGSKRKTKVS